jgi:hypothetical protein
MLSTSYIYIYLKCVYNNKTRHNKINKYYTIFLNKTSGPTEYLKVKNNNLLWTEITYE